MAKIYETENFILESHDSPHVTRMDWWHIKISPKIEIVDRSNLTISQAKELMRLTMLSWEAYILWMKKSWIKIERINYQDNWNWAYKKDKYNAKPHLHIHLYWRVLEWERALPDALFFPHKETWFYDSFEPLTKKDIDNIKNEILILENTEKYDCRKWE